MSPSPSLPFIYFYFEFFALGVNVINYEIGNTISTHSTRLHPEI